MNCFFKCLGAKASEFEELRSIRRRIKKCNFPGKVNSIGGGKESDSKENSMNWQKVWVQ